MAEVIRHAADFAKQELEGEATGHDWWHSERVWKNARHIAEGEDVDATVVELAAILHDVADPKTNDGDEAAGLAKVRGWLENSGIDPETIAHVMDIIATMSFSKTVSGDHDQLSLEAKVVQDADRLDALGAVGIARAFAFGGKHERVLYDPTIKPKLPQTPDEYKTAKTTTVNHFYDKLLLLKDRLNTDTARHIAEGRHRYMEEFLEQFYAEWEGKR